MAFLAASRESARAAAAMVSVDANATVNENVFMARIPRQKGLRRIRVRRSADRVGPASDGYKRWVFVLVMSAPRITAEGVRRGRSSSCTTDDSYLRAPRRCSANPRPIGNRPHTTPVPRGDSLWRVGNRCHRLSFGQGPGRVRDVANQSAPRAPSIPRPAPLRRSATRWRAGAPAATFRCGAGRYVPAGCRAVRR